MSKLQNYPCCYKRRFSMKGVVAFLNSGGRCRSGGGGSYGVGVGGLRYFGWPSVVVGG